MGMVLVKMGRGICVEGYEESGMAWALRIIVVDAGSGRDHLLPGAPVLQLSLRII